jgi:PAS domain S-box-containing protein
LHLAALTLLIICDLVLDAIERLTPLPHWFHLIAMVSLGGAIMIVVAALRKREGQELTGLRLEVVSMQQKMAKAARRYKSLLEGAGNAIFVFNAESGALEEVNRKGTELLGFSKDELTSMLGRDLLPPEEHERFRSFVFQLKRHGRADAEGLQFQRKDGTLLLGEINGRLIDLGDEQVVHCIVRDITEKRRTEREIWQRNRELLVLNNLLTGIARGAGGNAVPQDALLDIMELVEAGGGTMHLLGSYGGPPELCIAHHVSPQLEMALREFIAATPNEFKAITIRTEPEDRLYRSAAAEEWRSLTSVPLTSHDNLIGIIHLMHSSPHDYPEEELRFLATVGNQLGNVIEKERLFAELNWKSAELLRSHVLLEKTSHNLSLSEIKLKQNLDVVEQANLELSRVDRMKNQFLGMVSHEFNTPLTSIISGTEFLLQQKKEFPEGSGSVLEMVRDGGLRLRELVADLLKLIRLESRGGELQPSAIQLHGFLQSMKDQLRPQLDKRGQKVKLTDLDLLPFFEGDHEYLARVFGELLLNAMRFSPEGSEIEVTGRVVDKSDLWERKETLERFNSEFLRRCDERCYVEVQVRDHGIGVAEDEQHRIFDIFYEIGEIRHHSSGSSRNQGKGAGLGLAMVKGMVEAHGGMVWVESRTGSSFFLLLPLEQEVSQPALF